MSFDARSTTSDADSGPSGRTPLSEQQARAWTVSIYIIFAICGVAMATWMSRVPRVRDRLGATTSEMGWLVVAISIGSLIGLAVASHVIARIGAIPTMLIFQTVNLLGLLIAGVGSLAPSFLVIWVGLFVFGIGTSLTDVGMNLSGAANEKLRRKTLMPMFHALFSLGTVIGAGLGALAERLHVPVIWHCTAIVIAGLAAMLWAHRSLQDEAYGLTDADQHADHGTWRSRLAVWGQSTTLLIGLIMLGMSFAEGSANDWVALAMVDGKGMTNSGGAVMLGVFVASMTISRMLGGRLIDRFGRVPMLRACAALAFVGLSIVIFVPIIPLVVIGVVMWGVGSALGFPVGMSAAADDPHNAGARVSAVATIGYLAFLVGPLLIGFLGEHFGLLRAFLVVLALIAVAGVLAPAAREPRRPARKITQPGPG